MTRRRNPLRLKGPGRPSPQHVAGDTWRYRDRLIEVGELHGDWFARITYEHPRGYDAQQRIAKAGGPADDVLVIGPAPDPHAAMHHAVFDVDAHETFTDLARKSNVKWKDLDLHNAVWIVRQSIADLQRKNEPLSRSAVTRRIEEKIRSTRAGPGMRSAAPYLEEAISGGAFMALPLPERLQLVDDLIGLAGSYGGRWSNPKPDAHLLELHVTLLERQLAELVAECRRIANPADADLDRARAELAECSRVLAKVRAALGDQEGWRSLLPEAIRALSDPEVLARYAAQHSAERERDVTLQLRAVHALAPHESLVWRDFRVSLADDGRLVVRFKPKTTGAPQRTIRASRGQLGRALASVRRGRLPEDALHDAKVDMGGIAEASIIEYEDEAGDRQVRAFGVAA